MLLPGAENQPDGDASPTTRRHRGDVETTGLWWEPQGYVWTMGLCGVCGDHGLCGEHGTLWGPRCFVETMGVFGVHGAMWGHYLFETQCPRQGAPLQVAMSSVGQKQSFEQLLSQLTLFIRGFENNQDPKL